MSYTPNQDLVEIEMALETLKRDYAVDCLNRMITEFLPHLLSETRSLRAEVSAYKQRLGRCGCVGDAYRK